MTFFKQYLSGPTRTAEAPRMPAEHLSARQPENEQPHEQEKTQSTTRTSLISIVIAVALYSLFFGLPMAAGFVGLILIHEMGHVIVLKWMGYRATSPVFIPFVGALIGMQDAPKNAQSEALVAYGGPLFGTLGAYAVYLAALYYQSSFLMTLALTGFIINLFNMVPLSPLDGGRIATAISRWLWIPGMALLFLLFLQVWNPIILIVLAIGGHRILKSMFSRQALEEEGYFTVSPKIRFMVSIAYFGLILVLMRYTYLAYQQLNIMSPS